MLLALRCSELNEVESVNEEAGGSSPADSEQMSDKPSLTSLAACNSHDIYHHTIQQHLVAALYG